MNKGKLSKERLSILLKSISPLIYIDNEVYKEKFKQVYYYRQRDKYSDGYYLKYVISSFGRIFSIRSFNVLHELSPSIDSNGYNLIVLKNNSKIIGTRIHRLVAIAFIKAKNRKLQNEVNHIDGIKTHNYVWNLEWTTSSENKQHAIKHNLSHFAKGEDVGKSIYKEKQIIQVCKMLEENLVTKTEIAKVTGVSQHMVNDIYKRRYWNHVSCKYDFSKRELDDKRYIESIYNVCKLIEENKSYSEIEKLTGFDFRVTSEIYRKKKFKWISDQFDFSKYNYGNNMYK